MLHWHCLDRYKKKQHKKTKRKIIEVNFLGITDILEELLNSNIEEAGKIIIMSSISATRGSFDEYYAASKAALSMWAKSINKKFKNKSKVISIAPSLIKNSGMYYRMSSKNIEKHKKKRPAGLLTMENINDCIFDIMKLEYESEDCIILD